MDNDENVVSESEEASSEEATSEESTQDSQSKEVGTVKWFDLQKNYGFIGREGKDDVFVHANALGSLSIKEGDKVKFNVEQGEKGPSAVDVEMA